MNLASVYTRLNRLLAASGQITQPLLLLVLRLYWGWSFFQTGKGKLLHLDRTTEFFASLHLPLPKLNALMAGSVECGGGLLLMLGLASRVATVPLIFTLLVAYATAERDSLFAFFSDPDKFTSATPFLFLLAVVIIFAFGPGKLSLDAWLKPRARRRAATESSVRLEGALAGE